MKFLRVQWCGACRHIPSIVKGKILPLAPPTIEKEQQHLWPVCILEIAFFSILCTTPAHIPSDSESCYFVLGLEHKITANGPAFKRWYKMLHHLHPIGCRRRDYVWGFSDRQDFLKFCVGLYRWLIEYKVLRLWNKAQPSYINNSYHL